MDSKDLTKQKGKSKTMNAKTAKTSGLKKNLNKLLNISEDSEDSEDDVIPVKQAKEKMKKKEEELKVKHDIEMKKLIDEITALKKKNKKLSKEKDELQSEVLKELNLKFQKKFLDSPIRLKERTSLKASTSKRVKISSPPDTISPNGSPSNHEKENSSPYLCKSDFPFLRNIQHKSAAKKKVRRLSFSENSSPAKESSQDDSRMILSSPSEKGSTSKVSSSPANEIESSPTKGKKMPDHLTAEDLRMYRFGAKAGARRDSKFVKNLAVMIFTEAVLKKSSLTGKACPTNPKAPGKQPLNPEKVDYIRQLLEDRVKGEFNGKAPDNELLTRATTLKVKYYVREHIGWLSRFSNEASENI